MMWAGKHIYTVVVAAIVVLGAVVAIQAAIDGDATTAVLAAAAAGLVADHMRDGP